MGWFRWLLRLLPGEFRDEHGEELELTVQDQRRALGKEVSAPDRLRFWGRQGLALLRAAFLLRRPGRLLTDASGWRRSVESPGSNRGGARLDGLGEELRQSLRALAARPGFSGVSVVTIALGVGAATAMFSTVHAVLLRDLPYRSADEVVVLRQSSIRSGDLADGVSAANLADIAAQSRSFSQAASASAHGLRWMDDGRAISLRAWLVSEGFFAATGGETFLGRLFLPEEFVPGGERVVVLGHTTWRQRFGGNPAVLGRSLWLDGAPHRVIGVLKPSFRLPAEAEIWAPRPPRPWDEGRRSSPSFESFARLAPGVELEQAQLELDRLAVALREAYPEANADLGLRALSLRQHLFGDVQTPLMLLLGAVGLVMLVAAANLSGLQMVRASARAGELALRGALGASRGQILRLLGLESLLLAGFGMALGLFFADLATDLLRLLAPERLPRMEEVRLDRASFLFAGAAALGTVLLSSLLPTVGSTRKDPASGLGERSRGSSGGPRGAAMRDRLVIGQIAVALVLGVGAGLLVRSFDRLLSTDLGFEPAGRLAVQVWAYDEQHNPRFDYFSLGREALEALPGVDAVGLTTDLPMADDRSILSRIREVSFRIPGSIDSADGPDPAAWVHSIDDGYVASLGVELRAGRVFSPIDQSESPPVVMVNESFARRFFPDRDPVGQSLVLPASDGPEMRIVGVLGDVRRRGFASEPRPEIYRPLLQAPSSGLTFVVSAATDPGVLLPAVVEALREVDPRQAIWASSSLEDLLAGWNRHRRFLMLVLGGFAGLALALAAVGVYGTMSFVVEQRSREMGIRRVMGCREGEILALVLRRGLVLALWGAGIGSLASLPLMRLLRSQLYEITPFDPLTFAWLGAGVVGVTVLAAYAPARRAANIEPADVLRSDSR